MKPGGNPRILSETKIDASSEKCGDAPGTEGLHRRVVYVEELNGADIHIYYGCPRQRIEPSSLMLKYLSRLQHWYDSKIATLALLRRQRRRSRKADEQPTQQDILVEPFVSSPSMLDALLDHAGSGFLAEVDAVCRRFSPIVRIKLSSPGSASAPTPAHRIEGNHRRRHRHNPLPLRRREKLELAIDVNDELHTFPRTVPTPQKFPAWRISQLVAPPTEPPARPRSRRSR